jgi:hypothetical protein
VVLEKYEEKSIIGFSEQDILRLFPPEQHKKYDVVHVRFLVCALKKSQVLLAVRNTMELLSEENRSDYLFLILGAR